MLKAVELIGFKSFADKTRFEFPRGITVVVGPNGSGKSNVVDGIRWVLGEQSAKSLRGREMADVIFKGSGTGTRRPANTAEVSIIFDNTHHMLDVEAEEVSVTRRVYRSGEGEYLINGEACRLRDVKDLFRGTGVGADAYSLIEQGKVDTLLQASPRDRRAIFEEAAGISRFKAKKIESQRRLDRVQQNLLRLSDIVEEVERRLRSLRAQATKVRRYKDHNDRLKELRTQVGLADWRLLTSQLNEIEERGAELEQNEVAAKQVAASAETELRQLEADAESTQVQLRHRDAMIAKNREVIASHEASSRHQRGSLQSLLDERSRYQRQLVALSSRAGNVQLQLKQVQRDLAAAEVQYGEVSQRAEKQESCLTQLDKQVEERRSAVRSRQQEHTEQVRLVATLSTKLSGFRSELAAALSLIERNRQREEDLSIRLADAEQQTQSLNEQEEQLQHSLQEAAGSLEKAQEEVDQLRTQLATKQKELIEKQREQSALSERQSVLEDVERRLEGVGAGAKEILERASGDSFGSFSEVKGLVADLIEVQVDMAPMVDAVLGPAAQYVVVDGGRLLEEIGAGTFRPTGRLGVIQLATVPEPDRGAVSPVLSDSAGVIGRATDFVKVDSQYEALIQHLLGDTWFIDTLGHAIALRSEVRHPIRRASCAGEVIQPDGVLLLGLRHSSTGIVSRRSQLRTLKLQVSQLDQHVRESEQSASRLQTKLVDAELRLREISTAHGEVAAAYTEHHATAQAARERLDQLQQMRTTIQSELDEQQRRQTSVQQQRVAAESQLEGLQQVVAALETALQDDHDQIKLLEQERHEQEQHLTSTKIELATSQQRVEGLRVQKMRCQQDNDERGRAVTEARQQIGRCLSRGRETEQAILRATSQVAELYLQQEEIERELADLVDRQSQQQQQRSGLKNRLAETRQKCQEYDQSRHTLELEAGRVRLQRDGVAERVRDDYGIELASLTQDLTEEEESEREEVDREIADLRRKISNIGAVNMESLAELEELEERFGTLSQQYNDLVQAKESLERIIQKINGDSRRMFEETLESIRASFQTLFRRAFGGGHADIVLEDGVDLLESGVEIIATPPGKHSLNISLLSGGERALTAVTLLLAIFRYRPSPFCVLDEVDGPLDEANIGRFVAVLGEFLEQTKVVIVTHSKKTMSAATTLYGVTMQESGVSKRVSVQFEDVSEDGHISAEALQRQVEGSDGDERAA